MDTVMHVKVQNSRHLCWGALCLASRVSRAPMPRFADPNFQLQRGRSRPHSAAVRAAQMFSSS